MAIELDEAKKLAKLSRLKFTDDELKLFIDEFQLTLQRVEAIDRVNVDGIRLEDGDEQILATQLREDTVCDGLTQEDVLFNAPNQKDGAFLVPITVDEDGGK